MNMQNDYKYEEAIDTLAAVIKVYGPVDIWKDLKLWHPKEYNELLLAALEELPK